MEYITAGMLGKMELAIAPHMQIVDGGPLELSLISSRLNLVWVATVCGKLETRLRYSNSLVISPFLMGLSRRIHAAVFSFIAGVMPPMPMLGLSLL